MNNKFTDEQLDLIAANLLRDFTSDNAKLDEIADSPTLFRNIKREINLQKSGESKSWIELWYRQTFAFAAFATLVIGFGIGLIWLLNAPQNNEVAGLETPIIETKKVVEGQIEQPKAADKVEVTPVIGRKSSVSVAPRPIIKTPAIKTVTPKIEPKIIAVKQTKITPKQTSEAVEVKSEAEEIKTEFISLSYLPTPESGQIVRVKVPRSMMVSLGVSNNVSKNAELVSAEVILGDDGSSRAIRFISTNKR
jgi:hypothetical protein